MTSRRFSRADCNLHQQLFFSSFYLRQTCGLSRIKFARFNEFLRDLDRMDGENPCPGHSESCPVDSRQAL